MVPSPLSVSPHRGNKQETSPALVPSAHSPNRASLGSSLPNSPKVAPLGSSLPNSPNIVPVGSPLPSSPNVAPIGNPVPNSPNRGTSALPPMPPLLSYQGSASPLSNGLSSNKSSTKHSSPLKTGNHSPSYSVNTNLFSSSHAVPTTTTWLTALSEVTQGQKRPPPAHSGSMQPPAKRPYLDNLDKSATPSPSSNMSPLVGKSGFPVKVL